MYCNQEQHIMLIIITLVASFIGIVPSANVPTRPVKQENPVQVMFVPKTEVYDLTDKNKKKRK